MVAMTGGLPIVNTSGILLPPLMEMMRKKRHQTKMKTGGKNHGKETERNGAFLDSRLRAEKCKRGERHY